MFPPKETASVYVTKSPTLEPLLESVTVSVEDPLVAAKVAAPAALVRLILKVPIPTSSFAPWSVVLFRGKLPF